jgi:hypothetical protein
MAESETTITRADLDKSLAEARDDEKSKDAEFRAYMAEAGVKAEVKVVRDFASKADDAEKLVARLTKQLGTFVANERWTKLGKINSGVNKAMADFVKKGIVAPAVTEIVGTVDFDEKGLVSVSATIKVAAASTEALEEAIQSYVDSNAEEYLAAEVKGLQFKARLTGDDAPDFSVMPKGEKAAKSSGTKSAGTGSRVGKHGYVVDDAFEAGPITSHDLLVWVEANEPELSASHAKALETALRGTGYGMSNLAKAICAKLGSRCTHYVDNEIAA